MNLFNTLVKLCGGSLVIGLFIMVACYAVVLLTASDGPLGFIFNG